MRRGGDLRVIPMEISFVFSCVEAAEKEKGDCHKRNKVVLIQHRSQICRAKLCQASGPLNFSFFEFMGR